MNPEQAMYLDAKTLHDLGTPTKVLLMAAILNDDELAMRLAAAYPGLHFETMRRRWDSANGALLGDEQEIDQPQPDQPLRFLDRSDDDQE